MANGGLEAQMLAEARAEVAIADHKASMLLAALSIGYAAVFGGLLAGDWHPSHMRNLGEPLWWAGAVLALGSVGAAAAAVWPRFTATDVSNGMFYWGHVADYSSLAEFESVMEKQLPVAQNRTRHQLYRISRLVKRKYSLVRTAMVLSGIAALLFVSASLTGG